MAARISVVVPVFNVAVYLEDCLESLARQTMPDLEIVMVDDGSTDESPEIARRFAERDPRFVLMHQENAGLGAARNTGIDRSTGEFLAFVDSDDVVPRRAYEVLVGALDRTDSDFATGNVRRLTSLGTTRATFLGDAFDREQLRTHISRLPGLTADRLACNKLFRRAFWNRHELRFPEGVRNEDIPVMLPAHYLAGSVDVLAETVYLWRRREGGDLSGSQRRVGAHGLRARVAAVDRVSRFLADRGLAEEKLVYDRSVLAHDLRYFLDVLASLSAEDRELFLDLANDFLDRADPAALDQPLALERLKWQLVRRRALPELLEVLRFQAEDAGDTPPVRQAGRFYGDYPYRGDSRLGIPSRVYRLDEELALVARVDALRWEGESLRIGGYAYIEMIGAPSPGAQSVRLRAARPRWWRRPVQIAAEERERRDVTADEAQRMVSLDWAGFDARLDARRLRIRGRWAKATWTVGLSVRAVGVSRETTTPAPAPLHPLPAVEHALEGARLWAGFTPTGELEIRVQPDVPTVHSYSFADGVLRLEGEVGGVAGAEPKIRLRPRGGGEALDYSLELDRNAGRTRFAARVPLADLTPKTQGDAPSVGDRESDEEAWDAWLVGKGRRLLALPEVAPGSVWPVGDREVAVVRTRYGRLRLVVRTFRPVVTTLEWREGTLVLEGRFQGDADEYDLVARRRSGELHAVPLRRGAESGHFTAELQPAAVDSLAGVRPLGEGQWELLAAARGADRGEPLPLVFAGELLHRLPEAATVGHKLFRVGVLGYDRPVLQVERDLDVDERGGFRQRTLRSVFYPGQREKELRDAVLYDCFGGLEYSDSPRAIHEELVRRGTPLEHLWVVRDGRCTVPGTAEPVRAQSREYHEAYATARYVVASDHWAPELVRRPEQTWLQTWHGAPLKRLGHDLAQRPKAVREYRRLVRQPEGNWQYVVSPGAFATPILERALAPASTILETGLPRADVLFQPDREHIAAEIRSRLGIRPDARVVLYAPTYRDHLGARDGYRLGPLLDLGALRTALGKDDALLFRSHRSTVGASPAAEGVLDVSGYPDATELLLAVDVLVTDYSSAVFDFANTGRPLVFFTPDLEVYREIRGFSIDFEAVAPGPLLRTTGEVAEALRDLDAVRAVHDKRYRAFAAAYCPLDDGGASARVVERVFGL